MAVGGAALRRQGVGASAELRGRCITARGPCCGCLVRVAADSLAVQAGADGGFVLPVPTPPEGRRCDLEILARGFATVELAVAVTIGDVVDLGDVCVPDGLDLRLLVVDDEGLPVAGRFELCRTARGDEGAVRARTRFVVTSDANGRATVSGLLDGATWSLRCLDPILTVIQPCGAWSLVGRGGNATIEVRAARVAADAMLTGTVLDDIGAPVAGATVHALTAADAIVATATCDEDGAFVLVRPAAVPDEVQLAVPDVTGFERYRDARLLRWGSFGWRLWLRRAAARAFVVVAADSGAPVERFVLCWTVAAAGPAGPRQGRSGPGPHPRGLALVGGVPAEPASVEVLVDERSDFAGSGAIAMTAVPGGRAQTIALRARRDLLVTVIDSDGAPIAGSRVALRRGDEPCGEAATDDDGRARLRAGGGDEELVVSARGPHVPMQRTVLPWRREVVFVVPRGAGVTGAVEPPAVLAALRVGAGGALALGLGPRVRLRALAPVAVADVVVDVAADGSFAVANLPAGFWQLEFEAHTFAPGGALVKHRTAPVALDLPAGGSRAVTVDIAAIAPAAIAATVTRDGRPEAGVELQLLRFPDELSGTSEHSGLGRTDASGVLLLSGLPPGRYRVKSAVVGAASGTFLLQAGECRSAVIELGR